MLFLSEVEKKDWRKWGNEILAGQSDPADFHESVRPNLLPAFQFYAGTLLAAKGFEEAGARWIKEGAMIEEDGLFLNAFLASFLDRQKGKLIMPAVVFQDPAPFVHFSTVPILEKARENFIAHCCHSFPVFAEPFRIMDIGCGNGALLVMLLKGLLESERISSIGEILLIDSSKAMCKLAKETVLAAFPSVKINVIESRIQDFSSKITGKYDVAMSSLAYHHMPFETKQLHLEKLRPFIDHFVIFELDADNDTPELYSPEMALAVYQSYGRIIDFVFSHDAPIQTAQQCVDCFLMSEAVSFMIHKRGERTDYHMLRSQWQELFEKTLGNEFTLRCDSIAYTDEYLNLFTMHYGR